MSVNKAKPVARYAAVSPSAVMREIAAIALAKGFNQETLAKALRITPAAVMKHFTTKSPRSTTIEEYASVLSVPREYLGLYEKPTRDLRNTEVEAWLQRALLTIKVGEINQQFRPGTHEGAKARLKSLPGRALRKLAEAHMIGECRSAYFSEPGPLEGFPTVRGLNKFAEALLPYYDLPKRLWRATWDEALLVRLWFHLKDVLTPAETEQVFNTIRYILHAKGVDPSQMDAYLKGNNLYRQWALKERQK